MLINCHLKYEMIKCVITSSVSFSIPLNTNIESIETSYQWWLYTGPDAQWFGHIYQFYSKYTKFS